METSYSIRQGSYRSAGNVLQNCWPAFLSSSHSTFQRWKQANVAAQAFYQEILAKAKMPTGLQHLAADALQPPYRTRWCATSKFAKHWRKANYAEKILVNWPARCSMDAVSFGLSVKRCSIVCPGVVRQMRDADVGLAYVFAAGDRPPLRQRDLQLFAAAIPIEAGERVMRESNYAGPSDRPTVPGPPGPGLVVRETEPENLESPFSALEGLITPTERFYVRSHFPKPAVSVDGWRLKLEGAVERPFELS